MARTRSSPMFLLVIAASIALLGIVLVWPMFAGALSTLTVRQAKAAIPPLSQHALLHAEAPTVWNWLNTHDTKGCKWDCGDRTRYGCQMGNGQWIFAVEDAANVITAFFADQEYIVAHTQDDSHCHNPFYPMHP